MIERKVRTFLHQGRLFLRDGWFETETGERYRIEGGELYLSDGYLYLNGPLQPEDERRRQGQRRSAPDRRDGAERRQKEPPQQS